ncbi:TPA: capsid protein, partial [Streptococcus pneumoniae]|nr:capsid protein [Streptococcus pneumoniae]
MSIAIKVDLQKAKQKLSNESMTRGKIAVASKILLDNEQYIPLRGGELRASGRIVGQGDAVVYGTV